MNLEQIPDLVSGAQSLGACCQYPVIFAIKKLPLDSEVIKWEGGLGDELRRT